MQTMVKNKGRDWNVYKRTRGFNEEGPHPVRSFSPNKSMKLEARNIPATRAKKTNAGPAGKGETSHAQGANRKVEAMQTNNACPTQLVGLGKYSLKKGKRKAVWSNNLEQLLVNVICDDIRSGIIWVLPVSGRDGYWHGLLSCLPEKEMTALPKKNMTASQVYGKVKRMRMRYDFLQRQAQLVGRENPQFKNLHEQKLYHGWKLIWGRGIESDPTDRILERLATGLDEESSSEEIAGAAVKAGMGRRKLPLYQESSSDEEREATKAGMGQCRAQESSSEEEEAAKGGMGVCKAQELSSEEEEVEAAEARMGQYRAQESSSEEEEAAKDGMGVRKAQELSSEEEEVEAQMGQYRAQESSSEEEEAARAGMGVRKAQELGSEEEEVEAAEARMGQYRAGSKEEEELEAVSLSTKTRKAGINQAIAAGKAASTSFMSKPRLQYTTVYSTDTKRRGNIHSGEIDSRKLARILLEQSTKMVVLQERPRGTTRPYPLLVPTMLEGLVSLYFEMFLSHWPRFSKLNHGHPDDVEQACAKLARVYISGWINDLYYCLRAAVKSKDPVLFRRHFIMENDLVSDSYDEFLVVLNAMVRPTTLFHTYEESTAIPVFRNTDSTISPLNVIGLDFNEALHRAIIGTMIKWKEFRMQKLKVGATDGKPVWLLDWWRGDTAHTWIPFEGNFSLDDIAVAYIVGVPMTDINGPCDADIPNVLPRDYIHGLTHITYVRRVTARKFIGAVEERRITRLKRLTVKGSKWRFEDESFSENPLLNGNKVHVQTPGPFLNAGGEISTSIGCAGSRCQVNGSLICNILEDREFGIIEDFVYHAQVIRGVELQSRYRALSCFVYNSA